MILSHANKEITQDELLGDPPDRTTHILSSIDIAGDQLQTVKVPATDNPWKVALVGDLGDLSKDYLDLAIVTGKTAYDTVDLSVHLDTTEVQHAAIALMQVLGGQPPKGIFLSGNLPAVPYRFGIDPEPT